MRHEGRAIEMEMGSTRFKWGGLSQFEFNVSASGAFSSVYGGMAGGIVLTMDEVPNRRMPQSRRRVVTTLAAVAFAALSGCSYWPTHNPSTLKAIKAEAQMLMAQYRTDHLMPVPKSKWPPVIASLEPEDVVVFSYGVVIWTRPFFDGGWGYFVPQSAAWLPEPAGQYSALGQGVYWFHPY